MSGLSQQNIERSFLFLVSLILLHFVSSCSPEPKQVFSENVYKGHLEFLSNDLLDGRKPGTRGGDLAALYIAKQFEILGLQPVSSETGYYQDVPMAGFSTDYSSVKCSVSKMSGKVNLIPYEEIILSSQDTLKNINLEGDLVFAGYGTTAPEYQWDDFKDVDLSGKILVVLCDDPDYELTGFGTKGRTIYSQWTYKEEMAIMKGAKGIIFIHETEMADFPFSVVQHSAAPELTYLQSRLKNPLSFYAWVSLPAFEKMISMTDYDFKILKNKANNRDFNPLSLGLKINASFKQDFHIYTSPNVIGILPGTKKADECILYMAHYDHLGVGSPVDGDSIYNGARDNASGTAALITLAQAFSLKASERSILFLATTGEEALMLGSNHYATHPVIKLENTIIGFNMDMMSVYGRRSAFRLEPIQITTAYEEIKNIGKEMNMELLPDLEGSDIFRTDHLPLYSRGVVVPDIFLGGDYLTLTKDQVDKVKETVGEYYHLPNDEIYPIYRYDGILQQMEIVYNIGRYYADAVTKPALLPENPYKGVMRFNKIKEERGIY